MEKLEKEIIKLKLGLSLQRIIANNKLKKQENKAIGKKDLKLVTSLRQLEAASGVDFPAIQKISTGKMNASSTAIVAIADGLNLTLPEFWSYYEKITDKEALEYKRSIEEAKKKKTTAHSSKKK